MPDGLTGWRPARVLMTTDAVGGVWRYTLDLAAGFAARGTEIVIAVLGPPAGPAQIEAAEATPGLRLMQTGLPLDWTAENASEQARATESLVRLAGLIGATSVHLHAPALVGRVDWAAPVVAVAHSCVATWWHSVRGGPMPPDLVWRAKATQQGLRRASCVIAPSHAHAAALRAAYGPLDIGVIHNGRTATPLPSAERRRAVLTAGRLWDEGKNVAALDRAAAVLDAPVRAAGPLSGPHGAVVQFEHLYKLGTLDEAALACEYGVCTVFASMARYEPFGLAVLEAAAAGMALVLSDIPTFRELWDGAALFVSDEADLPATLRRALASPAEWGAKARDRAGRYPISATVDATLAPHRTVLA